MPRTKKHRKKGHPSGTPGGRPSAKINRSSRLAAIGHDISLLGGGPKRMNTADYAKYDEPKCNAHIEEPDENGKPKGKSGFIKTRTRKTKMGPAGSQYYVPTDTRPLCGQPAVVSKLDDAGKGLHRCKAHSFADE